VIEFHNYIDLIEAAKNPLLSIQNFSKTGFEGLIKLKLF